MAKSKKRGNTEINASSMADIAFLLLIFFLVTTTIDSQKGIMHRLPPWVEDLPDIPPVNERNVLEILINAQDYLLVEGNYMKVDRLRAECKKHVLNKGRLDNYSLSPEKAIVSLKNDRGTSYGIYLEVQNELKAAYREIYDAESAKETGNRFTWNELNDCAKTKPGKQHPQKDYCKTVKKKIKKQYPMKISEAEPESYQ